MSLYAIPNFIVAFIMFATGFFVFLKNKKSGINILFFLSAAAASIWQTGTAFAVLTNNPISALVATKFAFFGITLIPIFSYHLSLYISGVNKNKTVIFGYFLAFFCFIPLSWTSLILNGVYKYSWGYFFKAGILHPLFMVYFFCFMILIFTTLFFDYRKESRPVEKNRKKYFLYALFIAYIGSIDYLPTYGVDIYPGEVIGSGTVGTGCYLELNGTGARLAREAGTDFTPTWLENNDKITLNIDGLGELINTIHKVSDYSILEKKKNV